MRAQVAGRLAHREEPRRLRLRRGLRGPRGAWVGLAVQKAWKNHQSRVTTDDKRVSRYEYADRPSASEFNDCIGLLSPTENRKALAEKPTIRKSTDENALPGANVEQQEAKWRGQRAHTSCLAIEFPGRIVRAREFRMKLHASRLRL